MKQCTKCQESKPEDAFYRYSKTRGLRSRCKDCMNEAKRGWVKNNPDRQKELQQDWAKANPERVRKSRRKRYVKNKKRAKELAQKWREDNPEKAKEKDRVNSRRRRVGRNPESVEYAEILRDDICCYCGERSDDLMQIDHIEPVEGGGGNEWDNLTAACGSCNSSKYDHSLLEFMRDKIEV